MSSEIRSFRDLVVWQKAMALCKTVYRLSAQFPDSERFGLISQLRRAAVSVPCNIAEGRGRRGGREFVRFLNIARGSLCEVETLVALAIDLGYLKPEDGQHVIEDVLECGRVLFGLIRSIESTGEPR